MKTVVIRIPTRRVNVYLLVSSGMGILIDVGAEKYFREVFQAISSNGLQLSDIKQILLTHTHYDHVTGLKELRRITGARVLVHKNESEQLSKGYTKIPAGTNLPGKLISFLGRKLYPSIAAYPPVTADICMNDRYRIEDLNDEFYAIHTPGHTSGSVSYILNNEYAFVGDTLFAISKRSVFPPFADDIPLLMQSWKVLLETGCRVFYPGHGPPISRERFEKEYDKWTQKHKKI